MDGFEDGLVDGHPVWALVYVCLRLGDAHAALKVIEQAPQALGEFYTIMNEYAQRSGVGVGGASLSQTTTAQLGVQYRRSVNRSSDAYKRLVFCVLAKCDVMENHVQVCDKIEDYLWLKLSQVNTDMVLSETKAGKLSTANDSMSLEAFQNLLIEDYGEKHFQVKPFASNPLQFWGHKWNHTGKEKFARHIILVP